MSWSIGCVVNQLVPNLLRSDDLLDLHQHGATAIHWKAGTRFIRQNLAQVWSERSLLQCAESQTPIVRLIPRHVPKSRQSQTAYPVLRSNSPRLFKKTSPNALPLIILMNGDLPKMETI